MKRKVLVVASDAELRAAIVRILRPAGYAIELAGREDRARELLLIGDINAAIVVPFSLGAGGLKLTAEIGNTLGILIALAEDAEEAGQLARSLPGVLVLRSADRALLDRLNDLLAAREKAPQKSQTPELLGFEGRLIDLSGRTFYGVDSKEVSLTRAEFQLLATFVQRPGRLLSRDQLRNAVVGRGSNSYDRSIDMLVARLRRKIEPDPKVPRFILTLPGEGYKFAARPAAVQPPAPASMSHQEPSNLSVSFFERRLMTIVACQISGFAALASKHDPEVLHTATDSVCRKVQEIARPLHGIMMKTPGDGLLIYFGHLEAREDDAERAVRVSLELVRAVPTIDVGLTTQLHLRIGIATGVMLVGNIDGPQHYSAVGEALNLALHLRSVAPPDGVVIAISTHELLGRFFDFEKLEPVIVDDGATTAWRVTGESAVIASRFDALRRVGMLGLVGRDEQMELLLRRWQQAKCGAGQVVMLTGEPGIGKSRLVAEVEHRMAGEAHVLQKYFGLPHQADASMSALIGQLRTDCDFNQDNSTETKINKLADILRVADSDVAKSVALISDLLLLRSEDKHGIARLSPSERKKETFTTLLRRIERSAAVAPILVIVEDVHWIDPASLEFLALLVENVLALPVLIVMTSRPGFIPPWIGGANISVLELPRLGRSDAESAAGTGRWR